MAKKKKTTRSAGGKTVSATSAAKSRTLKKVKVSPATQVRSTKKKTVAPAKKVDAAVSALRNTSSTSLPKKKKKVSSRTATMSAPNRKSSSARVSHVAVEQIPEECEPVPLSVKQLRKVKSGLTRKDIEHYRQLLLQKRAQILGDVEALETDARSNSGDHMSPEHMADIGSSNYEQEFTLGLVESERKLVFEIDAALIRIREKTYGVCLESGVPIGKIRLDAKPWASYCIKVVREKESRGEL